MITEVVEIYSRYSMKKEERTDYLGRIKMQNNDQQFNMQSYDVCFTFKVIIFTSCYIFPTVSKTAWKAVIIAINSKSKKYLR
jgi:hypothetical protein